MATAWWSGSRASSAMAARMARSSRSCGARTHRGGRVPRGAHAGYVVPHDERIRQWIEIPEGMEIPPAAAELDRIGVTAPQVRTAADLDGMIVNVRDCSNFPKTASTRSGA